MRLDFKLIGDHEGGGGSPAGPSPAMVMEQLETLRTGAFGGSCKLFAFLRFVVNEAMEGKGTTLKELVIGDALYGGVQSYDPRIDSTVRVEARRLRRKLDDYYAGAGARDIVVVSIPTGSYAPLFALRPARSAIPSSDLELAGEGGEDGRPVLAVLPFTALCGGTGEQAFAEGITDELIYAAERGLNARIASRAATFQYRGSRFSLIDVAAQTCSTLVLHGTIRRAHDLRRVSLELTNRVGHVVWSDRIDFAGDGDLAVQESMAATIVGLLPSLHAKHDARWPHARTFN